MCKRYGCTSNLGSGHLGSGHLGSGNLGSGNLGSEQVEKLAAQYALVADLKWVLANSLLLTNAQLCLYLQLLTLFLIHEVMKREGILHSK